MAEEHKPRLDQQSRHQIKRLLRLWYSQLEREPVPARLEDLLSLPNSVGLSATPHLGTQAAVDQAPDENLHR
jgi:hypothetical protein